MVICPKCNTENAEDAKYCIKCGASLTTGEMKRPIMSDFRKALLATAVPILVISITGAVLSYVLPYDLNTEVGWPLWWVALGLSVVAFITAIVFGIMHKRSIASGIWVGIAISVIALGSTCFAILPNSF